MKLHHPNYLATKIVVFKKKKNTSAEQSGSGAGQKTKKNVYRCLLGNA